MAEIAEQQQQETTDTDYCEIEAYIFGAWVKIPVRVSSLRSGLRLPQHDIFTSGIFHGYTPHFAAPNGEVIIDPDHIEPGEQYYL